MNIHLIVDYTFLYYKYKFQLEAGRLKSLTTPVETSGVVVEKDISKIYYSIREIELLRRALESNHHNVTTSICFDSKSNRSNSAETNTTAQNEAASEYKSNRVSTLDGNDYTDILKVKELMSDAGHNTYKVNHTEADDLVTHLAQTYQDQFDQTIIVTCDLDLAVSVNKKISLHRFKSTKGYSDLNINNFCELTGAELKCKMPYNAILLYKSTVGDKSDNISGIKGFGPAAFDKLVSYINETVIGFNWETCATTEGTLQALEIARAYLTEPKYTAAIACLNLVSPKNLDRYDLAGPIKQSTYEQREQSYLRYNMASLVD